jgi:hypothetical protein
MEFSPGQRRIAFGVIVLVLVGLAAYLIGPARGASQAAPPHRGSQPGPAAPPSSEPDPVPSSPGPAVTGPATSTGDGADIYQWLPFTQAGLTAAATVALKFGTAYGTFSYAETATAYVAPMQSLCSVALAGQIQAAYSLPGVAAARSRSRQVSSGRATILSIRAFGPSSITFVVQIAQHQTATSGSSNVVTSYSVTLTGSGSAWQVTDIELAAAGNS